MSCRICPPSRQEAAKSWRSSSGQADNWVLYTLIMAKLLKLRLGLSDDPSASLLSLNDCLEAMLAQADLLIHDMLSGLEAAAAAPAATQRIVGFEQVGTQLAIEDMAANKQSVAATYRAELTRLVYQGGGKEQAHAEALRFEDLRLFEDDQLDQSIEVARAQQEVSLAVDDVLPMLDALVSTLLGWRTIQPGLNPVRPEVFVRALQSCLSLHVPDPSVREFLIAPAAGLLGANLRRLYRELSDWLRSCGVEPAVPIGGRVHKGSGSVGKPAADSVSKTLLTLDRLRKLLAGDFDNKVPRQDFLYTVPASMAMLQDMKQVDVLVNKLEQRPKAPAAPPANMPAEAPAVTRTRAPPGRAAGRRGGPADVRQPGAGQAPVA